MSTQEQKQEPELRKKVLSQKEKHRKGMGIYMLQIIHRKVVIPFTMIGSNIGEIIQRKMIDNLEGKCIIEGFVKYNSVRILNYSAGIMKSDNVVFDVVIECLICNPVEGMKFKVIAENITKAGIRGSTGKNSPVDVFIARDHHYKMDYFNEIKEGDSVTIRVLGQRYEINDPKISVIAEVVKPRKMINKKKPVKLIIE